MTPPRKARSRLQIETAKDKKIVVSKKKSGLPNLAFFKTLNFKWLIFIFLGYGMFWGLINRVAPSKIENFIFPQSYLPFHLILLLANFSLLSFIFNNPPLSLSLAILTQWLIFLRLQGFETNIFTLISLLSVLVLLIFSLLFRRYLKKKV